jgi:hypothetical protein
MGLIPHKRQLRAELPPVCRQSGSNPDWIGRSVPRSRLLVSNRSVITRVYKSAWLRLTSELPVTRPESLAGIELAVDASRALMQSPAVKVEFWEKVQLPSPLRQPNFTYEFGEARVGMHEIEPEVGSHALHLVVTLFASSVEPAKDFVPGSSATRKLLSVTPRKKPRAFARGKGEDPEESVRLLPAAAGSSAGAGGTSAHCP